MKKLLIVLVTAVMLLASGCGAGASKEEPTATPSASATATPTPTPKDEVAPEITLSAEAVETTVGKEVELPTATATDNLDGQIEVSVTGTVDWSKSGSYVITYTAIDTSGNQAQKTVVVTVKAKTTGNTTSNTTTSNNQTTNTSTSTPAPIATPSTSGCDTFGAKDPTYACDTLIDWEIGQYDKVYSGDSYGVCQDEGAAIRDAYYAGGEQPDAAGNYYDSFSCEEIKTNDWTFWGYGLKVNYYQK